VEVVRRGLEAHVVGRRIERVEVLHPRPVRRHLPGADHFADYLTGRLLAGRTGAGSTCGCPSTAGTPSSPISG